MSMTQEQINVDLFDQVKKLQEIKRRHEAEDLRLAQRDDAFRDAVEILLTDAKLVEMKPIFVEKAQRWLDSRDNVKDEEPAQAGFSPSICSTLGDQNLE